MADGLADIGGVYLGECGGSQQKEQQTARTTARTEQWAGITATTANYNNNDINRRNWNKCCHAANCDGDVDVDVDGDCDCDAVVLA